MSNNIISVSNSAPVGKSDHCVILAEILLPDLVGKKTLKVQNWAKADTKALANSSFAN